MTYSIGDNPLTVGDARLIEKYVDSVAHNNGIYVDVGTYRGCSASIISTALEGYKTRIITIDNCQKNASQDIEGNHETAKTYLDSLGYKDIEYMVGESYKLAAKFEDSSIDFCFIDADHTYPIFKKDLAAWWPKIRPGGLLVGHDYDKKFAAATPEMLDFIRTTDLNQDMCGVPTNLFELHPLYGLHPTERGPGKWCGSEHIVVHGGIILALHEFFDSFESWSPNYQDFYTSIWSKQK